MREGKRLPYPWLRNLRLNFPLFIEGDKVKRLWGIVRPCGEHYWNHLPSHCSTEVYTVEEIIFYNGRETYPSSCMWHSKGYQVKFREMRGIWYWADRFIKIDFTGWVAPASDLTKINRAFYKDGADYKRLWTMPCLDCKKPRIWPFTYGETGAHSWCWSTDNGSRIKKHLDVLKDFFQDIDIIAPGKLVRPRGPAVFPAIAEHDAFIEPLNLHQEYMVKDFLHGDCTKVLLLGADGAYSVNFLEIV